MTTRRSGLRSAVDLFTPVKTMRTFEEVLEQIVDRIRAGELQKGDRLPSERALATAMNVSRPTVRQALATLVDAEMVEVRPGPGGGAEVKSMWVPEGLVRRQLEARTDEIFEVLEARRALEPRLAELASVRGRDEHFAKMEESIDLMRQNAGDRSKLLQADFAFHRCMWQAAGNAALERLMATLFRQLEAAREMILRTPSDMTQAIAIHARTLAALRRGASDEVEAAMDEHLALLEEFCESTLGRPRVRPLPAFLVGRHSPLRAAPAPRGHDRA